MVNLVVIYIWQIIFKIGEDICLKDKEKLYSWKHKPLYLTTMRDIIIQV